MDDQKTRVRAKKRKMPGQEISIPTFPTVNRVKEEQDNLIQNGEILLGEPCAPYTLTRWTVNKGEVEENKVEVYSKRIPLTDVRKKLLEAQEELMHLDTDEQLENKSREELVHMLVKANEATHPHQTTAELREQVKHLQRCRHLLMRHDHATILGSGYILITVTVLYDPLVFMNDAEYMAKTGKRICNIQQVVEEPHIHMIAVGSLSVFDQLAIIGDRVDCLYELPTKIKSTKGMEVSDHLCFFAGDKPAQSFERGTQQGGHYKCGGCGVRSEMMADQAHSLCCQWRSLEDLQSLVLAGTHGDKSRHSKPFDKPKVAELREELTARGETDVLVPADELQDKLSRLLKGVQCVPSLLIL